MHDHSAVILVPVRERAFVVLGVGALGLFGPPGPAIQAYELLDVLGGPVQADLEEVGSVLRRRDAGQGTDLGEPSLPMAMASESRGSSGRARATRTFSRAVCVSMPHAQLSQWAQVRAP